MEPQIMRIVITKPTFAKLIEPGDTILHEEVDLLVDEVSRSSGDIVRIYGKPTDRPQLKLRTCVHTTSEALIACFPKHDDADLQSARVADLLGPDYVTDVAGFGIIETDGSAVIDSDERALIGRLVRAAMTEELTPHSEHTWVDESPVDVLRELIEHYHAVCRRLAGNEHGGDGLRALDTLDKVADLIKPHIEGGISVGQEITEVEILATIDSLCRLASFDSMVDNVIGQARNDLVYVAKHLATCLDVQGIDVDDLGPNQLSQTVGELLVQIGQRTLRSPGSITVDSTLQPWQLDITIEPNTPPDPEAAQPRTVRDDLYDVAASTVLARVVELRDIIDIEPPERTS